MGFVCTVLGLVGFVAVMWFLENIGVPDLSPTRYRQRKAARLAREAAERERQGRR